MSSVCPMPICRLPKRKSKMQRSRSQARKKGVKKPMKKTTKRTMKKKMNKTIKKAIIQKKCYKEGIVTRNPFFNFLRQFRKTHCGMTIIEHAIKGAKIWNNMNLKQKCPFMQTAHCAPPFKRRSKSQRGLRRVKKMNRGRSGNRK